MPSPDDPNVGLDGKDQADGPYSRREFLKLSALAALGLYSLSVPSWLYAVADLLTRQRDKTLVVLFQRGAADGLNMVVPFREADYYRFRPSIAIKAPGEPNGSLDLDGNFGLHPALAPLMPLWKSGQMALIHAAGSPDPTRSHFEAQDNMETGTPGIKTTPDGWLNRALGHLSVKNKNPLTALAVSPRLPRALRGNFPVTTLNSLDSYRFFGGAGPEASFEMMYEKSVDLLLSGTGQATADSVNMVQDIMKSQPENLSAGYGKDHASKSLSQLARVIKAKKGLRAGFLDIGGWDHHANEGSTDGQLNSHLSDLGTGIAAFFRDLGDQAGDVVLVTMTEFGRTIQENGDRGTDHGHGSVMTVIGGEVKGGKVYGRWPGLQKEALFEGRDLEVTTDFRQVLTELLDSHLGLKDPDIFPGFQRGDYFGLV
jgi:uncharacterized protein (DUF1501 family)